MKVGLGFKSDQGTEKQNQRHCHQGVGNLNLDKRKGPVGST